MKVKLELEALENRLTPNAMKWAGPGTAWATAANWFDKTNNAVATRVPVAGDVVTFEATSPISCVIANNVSAACLTISSDPNWGGTLEFVGNASLNIWGKNSAQGQSSWMSGNIGNSGAQAATINLIGGSFTISDTFATLNTVFPNPTALNFYINNSGTLKGTGTFWKEGANLYDGYNTDGTASIGTVTWIGLTNSPVTTFNDATTYISNLGYYNLMDGSITDVICSNCQGAMTLWADTSLDMDAAHLTLNINGPSAILDVEGTGTATIGGNVGFSGSKLVMGGYAGQYYSRLSVTGSLTMSGTTYSADVNNDSLTQCDNVMANTITLGANNTLKVYSVGPTMAGNHEYDIMIGFAGLGGTFSTYIYAGPNPHPLNGNDWTPVYTAARVELTGLSS